MGPLRPSCHSPLRPRHRPQRPTHHPTRCSSDASPHEEDRLSSPPGTPYETFINALRSEVDALRRTLTGGTDARQRNDQLLTRVIDRLPELATDQEAARHPLPSQFATT
jgi:hypothetical protein